MDRLLQWLGMCWLAASLALASVGLAAAQSSVVVRLEPAGASNVSGTATLTAVGAGTQVTLQIAGLAPGSTANASMHAGTCATPSASAAALPALTAGAKGEAAASGPILFRGSEQVALADIADGAHNITVSGPNGVIACGVIPSLATGADNNLPATGSSTPWLLAGLLLSAGLLAIAGGLWLQNQRNVGRRA